MLTLYIYKALKGVAVAISKDVRKAIKAKLLMGMSVKEVAELFEVKVPTVYTIKRELGADKEYSDIVETAKVDEEVLHTVVSEVKQKLPEISKPLQEVKKGLDGIKLLDNKFQETITFALRRYDEILQDPETPLKDITSIVNTTATAYEKVFNSGTNIHIGDNNSSNTQQLTIFKNKMGV